MITVTFIANAASASKSPSASAIFVGDDTSIAHAKEGLGNASGYVSQSIAAAQFKGKKGETLTLLNPHGTPSHILVIGLGKASSVKALTLEEAGAAALAAALAAKVAHLDIIATAPKAVKFDAATIAAYLASGVKLRAYAFDKYKTKIKAEDKPKLKTVSIRTHAVEKAKKHFEPLAALAESVAFTRDIVSEPANIIYPETLAAQAKTLEKLGVKIEILGEAAMKKLGMGALLGVGQGSVRESQLVVMQWNGGKKGQKPVALVGKGVTFDTGGISIKPANGMEEMKWDMGGSATVIGTM
ncbi:MAG: hypothetical protein K2X09_06015, partial [Rickettsiales bacterium]|nr:hypothetical protein [Rickettsiales bacterium]